MWPEAPPLVRRSSEFRQAARTVRINEPFAAKPRCFIQKRAGSPQEQLSFFTGVEFYHSTACREPLSRLPDALNEEIFWTEISTLGVIVCRH